MGFIATPWQPRAAAGQIFHSCAQLQSRHHLSRRLILSTPHAAAASTPLPDDPESSQVASTSGRVEEQKHGFWSRLKGFFGSGKLDKQRLAEYGMGAFAAYGIISNVNAGICMTIAWLSVVNTTGLTPLDPGQWPKFLGIYAGLWVGASFMRPIRLSLALAAAPAFNRFLEATQQRLSVNKGVAFGILLAMIAVSSCVLISVTIFLCGGFPNGLPWLR